MLGSQFLQFWKHAHTHTAPVHHWRTCSQRAQMIVMQHTRLSVFLVCSGLPSIRMILVYHYHCLVTFLSRLLSVFFFFYIFSRSATLLLCRMTMTTWSALPLGCVHDMDGCMLNASCLPCVQTPILKCIGNRCSRLFLCSLQRCTVVSCTMLYRSGFRSGLQAIGNHMV